MIVGLTKTDGHFGVIVFSRVSIKRPDQLKISADEIVACMAVIRCCLSDRGIVNAFKIVSAYSCTSLGFTYSAPVSSFAAPAASLSTKTPDLCTLLATYSLQTRFIPSLSGVTKATSAVL